MKFAYDIMRHDPEAIWLEDLSPALGCMSLTNAAEDVIQDLLRKNLILAGKRVYYMDTEGTMTEMCHDGKVFTGFAPCTYVERYPARLWVAMSFWRLAMPCLVVICWSIEQITYPLWRLKRLIFNKGKLY